MIANKTSWTIIGQIDAMRNKKIDISLDDYNNTGFPFSFATILDNVTYRNHNRSFVWKTNEVTIKVPLSNMQKIMVDIPQEQFFFRHHVETGGQKNIHKIVIASQICKAELGYKAKNLDTIRMQSANGTVKIADSQE